VLRPDVVVTNQHVVGDAREVVVVFADGTESPASVSATDTVTDLAVLRPRRQNLPAVTVRPDLPRPGERVFAVGSPLGFSNSVTAGIVSGLHREIPGSAAQSQSLVDLIQTDAAISPGNSGGALLDIDGRLVGINEAYIPPSAGAVSLGFAIPTATVLDITEQLLADGTAEHPCLGVTLAPLTPAIREQLGVRTDRGALVVGIDDSGPAADAGVRAGDIIIRLGEDQVNSVEDLRGATPARSRRAGPPHLPAWRNRTHDHGRHRHPRGMTGWKRSLPWRSSW
jgi:serine protease Do